MDFGLFYYCQGRGVPHDQAYAEMLDQIGLAERLGFGECWFAEHHFTDYSILPSPNLMIASALQRTRRSILVLARVCGRENLPSLV
jgi:alkanesulfonate monooxygenase SsuD/methylene tetrahydromethanopterin reductase-like flavin-dependent oxidoreductase (luciferase family)